MNILVATLGTTWAVVPEILAFTNPDALPLYRDAAFAPELERKRREYDLQPVDEVWVLTTVGEATDRSIRCLREWQGLCPASPALRIWRAGGVAEFEDEAAVLRMGELIYRAVLGARARAGGGRLHVSLAGGRKTMSADLQLAAERFGCDAVLHVIDREGGGRWTPRPSDMAAPLPRERAELYLPLVCSGRLEPHQALSLAVGGERPIDAAGFPLLPPGGGEFVPGPEGSLREAVETRVRRAGELLMQFRKEVGSGDPLASFPALYMLPPSRIERLRAGPRLGTRPEAVQAELGWLRRLPKAELHCHLGGVLDPAGAIRVAQVLRPEVEAARRGDGTLDARLGALRGRVEREDLPGIDALVSPHGLRELPRWCGLPRPLAAAAFLLQFSGAADLLERWLYRDVFGPDGGIGAPVGFRRYEALGDLQGSALLGDERTLRACCDLLLEQCRTDHVRYLELRCSPLNYAGAGFTPEQVVEVLVEALGRSPDPLVRLLFIASRHRTREAIGEHIELATRLLERSDAFRSCFAGFDLAGDEAAARPGDLRRDFAPLRRECIPLTIHAGETQPVANIWEAAYELAADRIGHGLTLEEDERLRRRFRDRRIAIEMCPTSNALIRGYRDCLRGVGPPAHYPLRGYLDEGLLVTVNTDNPGISRSTLSAELHRAAALTEGGLSPWEILVLVHNAFEASFCDHDTRRRQLAAAQEALLELLTREDVP